MLTVNRMTRWQAFMWLWRHDAEARWFWFKRWLTGTHLKHAVMDNYRDFGATTR